MTDEYEDYVKLLNSQPEGERDYQALIIEHSAFSQTYYLGFDNAEFVGLDNNGVQRMFTPANISAVNPSNDNDLSQTSSFSIGDLYNVLDDELDLLPDDTVEPILVTHLRYTSSSETPAEFITYDAKTVAQKEGVFTISCGAPDLNKDQTGEAYTLDQFPALRGYS